MFLATSDGRAIFVTTKGWKIVDRVPITFRRSMAMLRLDDLDRGGNLDVLFALLNVADDNRPLFAAWMTSALFERLPHPAPPIFRGGRGSAKSTRLQQRGNRTISVRDTIRAIQ